MSDYGTDIGGTSDLDFTLVTGRAVVIQAVARRLLTPRGSLFYAPDYGIDLSGLLNARFNSALLARWKSEIERQAEQDDRVASCTATLTVNGQQLKISVALELADGIVAAFDLVSRPGAGTFDIVPVNAVP